jgi:hypothetical protein
MLAEDVVAPWISRPSTARRWTATRCARRTSRRHARRPEGARLIGRAYRPDRLPARSRPALSDRDRRADPGRRRRGGDGRGRAARHRRRPAPAWLDSGEQVLVLAGRDPASTPSAAAPDLCANDVVLRGTRAHAGPDRRPGGHRARSDALAEANRGDLPHRQRSGAAGAAAAAGAVYDSTRSPSRRWSRGGGVAERHAPVPDTIERPRRRSTRRPGPTSSCSAAAAPVGERDVVIDAVAARGGDFPRDRRQAGQADCSRPPCPSRRPSAGVRLPEQPDVLPVAGPRAADAGAAAAGGLPPIDPPRVRRAWPARSAREPAPVPAGRIEGDLAVPTFRDRRSPACRRRTATSKSRSGSPPRRGTTSGRGLE